MNDAFETVAIVGHGLIGGSVALACAARMPRVRVVTLDRGDDLARAAGADLVVLAAPPRANVALLEALRTILPAGTLVTDTGSTKQEIVGAGAGCRFIGGHPIAGAATGGRESARPDLFAGRSWILTPAAGSDPLDVARLRTFIERLGASVSTLEAAEHDRLLAFISHLPQLAVSALMKTVGDTVGAAGLELAGPGLRDSTRLAASPPDLWRDIVASNRRHVTDALDDLIARLRALRADESGDVLTETFDDARRWNEIVRRAGPSS